LNYDGMIDQNDRNLAFLHSQHWHRNALFGTLVRRTNYCETCTAGAAGTIGESEVFWSPDGQQLSFTSHQGPVDSSGVAACKVFLVRSSPTQGNAITQFTFPDSMLHDYDPSWSPLGTEIAFGRDDWKIIRKGIRGSVDTSLILVTASGNHHDHGDLTPAISPDGQWVAFARKDQVSGRYNLWKISIRGESYTLTQLTNTTNVVDFYPEWSPDQNWITFDRQIGPRTAEHHAYKVKSNGDSLSVVFDAPSGQDAATPGYSADGQIITAGIGVHDSVTRNVRAYTLDPSLAQTSPILTYAESTFAIHGPDPVLSPRISPDGTRLALRAKQIFAARRNMNLPPVIATAGGGSIADTTVLVSLTLTEGTPVTFAVTASDPEGDPITYAAYFLQLGMTFDSSHTFSWTPPHGAANHAYYVRFQTNTLSGGCDFVTAKLIVQPVIPPGQYAARPAGARATGPNPTRGTVSFVTPFLQGATATVRIFDASGRVVATLQGPSGAQLLWRGRDSQGAAMPSGVYFYSLDLRGAHTQGRVVLVR
jgi:Tol biopolymer transport system component